MTPESTGGDAPRRFTTTLGRRGIALPLALLGLVAVTLLVTTLLLTSGTEFAVSAGQSDASRSLFNADGALQQWVATRAGLGNGTVNKYVEGNTVNALVFNGTSYTVSQARLVRNVVLNPNGGVSTETWSVIAAPGAPATGRGVGAFIQVQRTLANARINVSAGFTSGGNVTIGGSSLVSDGTTGQTACDSSTAPYSVEVTAGATINAGEKNVEGATHVSSTTKAQLVSQVLGTNVTLETLAQLATLRFGPFYGTSNWPNNIRPNDSYSLTQAPDSLYNWGCPAADIGTSSCHGGEDRLVVVGIDAQNLNQRTVKLNGDWGQGILIVLHGSLEVQGNFVFRGIVLVDEDLKMTGTGRGDGKLEGTIVAFGDSSSVTDDVRGNAMIRYNRCSINDAQNALNSRRIDQMPQALTRSPFAWFELVR